MLLINNSKSQAGKLHAVFYNGMSAHKYLNIARLKVSKYFFSLLSFYNSCEQFHTNVHTM